MSRYTTIFRGSERKVIESDRLDRFLEAGWTTKDTKKSTSKKSAPKKKLLPKVEIKAEAEVNHNKPQDDHVCDDQCDHTDDMSDIEWEINNLKEENNDGDTNR